MFLRRSVDQNVMRFQSEDAVFKFLQRIVDIDGASFESMWTVSLGRIYSDWAQAPAETSRDNQFHRLIVCPPTK